VISLRPDLLMVPAWLWRAARTAHDQIAAAGIPVLVFDYNAQTLDAHMASTRAIGLAMGTVPRTDALIDRYRRNVESIRDRAARAAGPSRPRAYVELGQGGAEVIGNSYSAEQHVGGASSSFSAHRTRRPGASRAAMARSRPRRCWASIRNSSSSALPPG
jgi:ABC-type Fe3+-hydroxamate transport system substrate-binding protein